MFLSKIKILNDFLKRIKQSRIERRNNLEILRIYYDYRTSKELATSHLVKALKQFEGKDFKKNISKDEILHLFFSTEKEGAIVICIYLISRLSIKDEKIGQRLLILLHHTDEVVRRTAAILLTELGTVEGLNAVVAGNRHGHAIRTAAAWKLKEMGAEGIAAIPGLIALLRDKQINWRSHAAAQYALSEMGEEAKIVLMKLLDDEDEAMREHAAIILELMDVKREN